MDVTNGPDQALAGTPANGDTTVAPALSGGIVNAAAATAPSDPPAPAPAPAPAAPEKPGLWRGVLLGALSGMAASAGGKNFGEGLALGVKGDLARQQQEKDDSAAQDTAKQAQIQQAASIAHTQAMTAQVQRQTMDLPENHQQTVIEGRAEQTEQLRRIGAMIAAGTPDPSPDHHVALQQVIALTKANPGKLYTAEPVKNSDGKIVFQAFQSTDSPLSEDVDLKDIDGKKIGIIPKGTPATQATKLQVGATAQGISDLSAKAESDRIKANAATIKAGAAKTAADKKGSETSGLWKPKVTADEKKKAELGENVGLNSEEVAKLIQRRPDLIGIVNGRISSGSKLVGTNDPDLTAIDNHVYNIAAAINGVHGLRSEQANQEKKLEILNNFKNGAKGIGGALMANVKSVQTFIDEARPETYKTHSKMGGVLKGMAQ